MIKGYDAPPSPTALGELEKQAHGGNLWGVLID